MSFGGQYYLTVSNGSLHGFAKKYNAIPLSWTRFESLRKCISGLTWIFFPQNERSCFCCVHMQVASHVASWSRVSPSLMTSTGGGDYLQKKIPLFFVSTFANAFGLRRRTCSNSPQSFPDQWSSDRTRTWAEAWMALFLDKTKYWAVTNNAHETRLSHIYLLCRLSGVFGGVYLVEPTPNRPSAIGLLNKSICFHRWW